MVVHPRRLMANVLFVPALLATLVVTTGCPSDPVVPPPPAAPSVVDFTVDRGEVGSGESVTFTWKTENATKVSISDATTVIHSAEGETAANGTHTAAITSGGTFVLTAEGADGMKDGARVAIVVRDAPAITEFIATPADVLAGGETVLRWKVTNGTKLELKTQGGMSILNETDASIIAQGSKRVVVGDETIFVLEAHNAAGSHTATVSVGILRPARISAFSANPTLINAGETSTLSWTAQDAVSVTISGNGTPVTIPTGVDPNAGSVAVTPSVETEYVLTAIGAGGNATESLTLAVRPLPSIATFTLTPATIKLGQETAHLEWTTSNATSVELTETHNGVSTAVDLQGAGVNDGIDVAPTAAGQYTYQLRAIGVGGETLSEVRTLVVEDPAPVVTLTSDVTTLTRGQPVTLTWVTENAATVSLVADSASEGTQVIDLTGKTTNDFIQVTPANADTYTFTMTAENSDGVSVSGTPVSVTVTPPAPTVVDFAANKPGVTVPSESFELAWTTTDANTVTITETDDVGTVTTIVTAGPAAGTHTVTLQNAGTYTYQLTATGPTMPDAISSTVTVTAAVDAPVVNTFVASPNVIDRGSSVTLTWSGDHATSYRITANGEVIHEADAATVTTTHTPAEAGTVLYEITAIGAGGERLSPTTQTVTVDPPAPVLSNFEASPATADRDAPVTFTWTATDAATLELSDGTASYDVTGLTSFDVTHTTTGSYSYTLTATNTATTGVQTATAGPVAVEVVTPNPAITQFAANPSTIMIGQSVTLSWTAMDVDAVSLTDGTASIDLTGKNPSGDSIVLTPTDSGITTYTLVAHRAGAPDSAPSTVEVTVNTAAPTIVAFDIQPRVVTEGNPVQLTWETTNSDDVFVLPIVKDATLPFAAVQGMAFEDLSASANATELTDAQGAPFAGDETIATLTFPAGFTFRHFGADQTSAKVSANGVIGFGSSYTGLSNNGPMGAESTPLSIIAPFWDDLKAFPGTSKLLYEHKDVGTAEERLVIQWNDFGLYQSGSTPTNTLTFQVALFKAGDVEFRYGNHAGLKQDDLTGGSATIGLQGPSQDLSFQYSYADSGSATTGKSLRLLQRIGGANSAAPGTDLVLAQTESISLVAVGFNGSVRSAAAIEVRVVAPAVATSFEVDRSHVGSGNAAILSWNTTDATEWKILANGTPMAGVPQAAAATLTVHPTETTEYTLVAENDADDAAQLVRNVTVGVPLVSQFQVDEAIKQLGETATFNWGTQGAETLSLTADNGDVLASLSDSTDRATMSVGTASHVTVAGTHTYTLTLVNGSGTTTQTIDIESTDQPRVVTFAPTAERVTTGHNIGFTWTTANAERVTVSEVTDCAAAPNRQVFDSTTSSDFDPGATQENAPAVSSTQDVFYKLVVQKAGSTPDEACVTVRVLALPTFTSVSHSPNPAYVGQTTTLEWSSIAEDVATVRIVRPDGTIVADGLASTGTHDIVLFNATEDFVFQGFNEFGVQGVDQAYAVNLVVPPPSFTTAPVTTMIMKKRDGSRSPAQATLEYAAENVQTVSVAPGIPQPVAHNWIEISNVPGVISLNTNTFASTTGIYSSPTLPDFTFKFMGAEYSEFRAAASGYITFDMSASNTTGNSELSEKSTPYTMVAPFWDNLRLAYSSTTPANNSKIYFALTGAAPNRTAVIQYSKVTFSGESTTPSNLNFQIQFSEDGRIAFAYDTMTCGSTCSSTEDRHRGTSANIGIWNGLTGLNSISSEFADLDLVPLAFSTFAFATELPPQASLMLSPEGAREYEFTAANETATVTETVRLNVVEQDQLIVNEILADPFGNDTGQEWIEIRNLMERSVDLRGLTITTNSGSHTIGGSAPVPLPGAPGTASRPSVVLLAQSADSAVNGGIAPAYAYGSDINSGGLDLGNNSDVISLKAGDGVFDALGYSNDPSVAQPWPVTEGKSLQVTPGLSQASGTSTTYPKISELVDSRSLWCSGEVSAVTGLAGSPGGANEDCFYTAGLTAGGTFQSITAMGTTVTDVISSASISDDRAASSVALPFNFNWFGQSISNIHVCTNGYISLSTTGTPGTSCAYSPYEMPGSPTTTYQSDMLAPFFADLFPKTTGRIASTVIGTAPNRTYVLEWIDIYPRGQSSSDILEFQIHLHESGGFSYHYGNLVGARSSLQVGSIGYKSMRSQVGFSYAYNPSSTASSNPAAVFPGDIITFTPRP